MEIVNQTIRIIDYEIMQFIKEIHQMNSLIM